MREMRSLFLSPMMVGASLNNMIEYTRKMINYTCSMGYLKSRDFFCCFLVLKIVNNNMNIVKGSKLFLPSEALGFFWLQGKDLVAWNA